MILYKQDWKIYPGRSHPGHVNNEATKPHQQYSHAKLVYVLNQWCEETLCGPHYLQANSEGHLKEPMTTYSELLEATYGNHGYYAICYAIEHYEGQ